MSSNEECIKKVESYVCYADILGFKAAICNEITDYSNILKALYLFEDIPGYKKNNT